MDIIVGSLDVDTKVGTDVGFDVVGCDVAKEGVIDVGVNVVG